jgi:hypothetical protein
MIYGNTIERVGGSTSEITLRNDLSRSYCVSKSCFLLSTNNHKGINRGLPEGIILPGIDQFVCWAYTHAEPHLHTLMTKRFTSGGDCQHEMHRRKWRCNVDTLKGPLDHQGRHFIKGSSRRWSTRDEMCPNALVYTYFTARRQQFYQLAAVWFQHTRPVFVF